MSFYGQRVPPCSDVRRQGCPGEFMHAIMHQMWCAAIEARRRLCTIRAACYPTCGHGTGNTAGVCFKAVKAGYCTCKTRIELVTTF